MFVHLARLSRFAHARFVVVMLSDGLTDGIELSWNCTVGSEDRIESSWKCTFECLLVTGGVVMFTQTWYSGADVYFEETTNLQAQRNRTLGYVHMQPTVILRVL